MLALEDLLKQFADGTILQRQARLLQFQGSTATVDGLIGEVSASELRLIPNRWRLAQGREHVVNISHSGSVLSQELLSFARHELRRIERLVEDNVEQCMRKWNEHFGT